MAKRVATAGIFATLALIFSYVEALIPFSFGVPGIKLGLANLVVVTGLYLMKLPEAGIIALIRILLSGLLFGNLMSILYSLAGGTLSFAVMVLLRKTGQFSVIGISIAGGVFHNVGQILMAMMVTGVPVVAYYLPILMGVGILTGLVIGFIASRVLLILKRSSYFNSSRYTGSR